MKEYFNKEKLALLGIKANDPDRIMTYDHSQSWLYEDANTGKTVYQKMDLDIEDTTRRARKLVADSAAQLNANIGFPLPYYTFFNPNIIPILYAADKSHELLDIQTHGTFDDKKEVFTLEEISGSVQAYSDFNSSPQVNVNYETVTVDQFRFQTSLIYGDSEVSAANKANINLIARKQAAAAQIMAKAHEKINLFGVKGLETYGFLNNPNYASAINAPTVTLSDGKQTSKWDEKSQDKTNNANFIVDDIKTLFRSIQERNAGLLSPDDDLILVVSPVDAVNLLNQNSFGITCKQMLATHFPNLKIVETPLLSDVDSGRRIMLFPRTVQGRDFGNFAVTERFTMGRVIQNSKSVVQDCRAGTWGAIIYYASFMGIMVVS